MSTKVEPTINTNQDPLYDPIQPYTMAQGLFKLLCVCLLIPSKSNLILVGDEGEEASLEISIEPVDEDGNPISEDDPIFDTFIDDP